MSSVEYRPNVGWLSAELGNDGIYIGEDNIACTQAEVAPYWLVELGQNCKILAVFFFNNLQEIEPGMISHKT